MLDIINPELYERLKSCKTIKSIFESDKSDKPASIKKNKSKKEQKSSERLIVSEQNDAIPENSLSLGDFLFETTKIKGKKTAILPLEYFRLAVMQEKDKSKLNNCGALRGQIKTKDNAILIHFHKLIYK